MKRYIRSSYQEDVAAALEELNSKLPTLKTWSDLEAFRREMEDYGYGFHFAMKTKKGGNENGMWKRDDTTVDYITDRTNDVYKSQIKNLHRVMKVAY